MQNKHRKKTNKNKEKRMKTWKKAEKNGKMKKCTKKYPSGGANTQKKGGNTTTK